MIKRFMTIIMCCGVVFSLTACSARPSFSVPIRWGDGSSFLYGEREDPRFARAKGPMIELREDGKGFVRNAPRGQQIDDDSVVRKCLYLSDEELYTGEITWKVTSEWTFEIEFPGSLYTITDDHARFYDQDWLAVRIPFCDLRSTYWRLSLNCGGYDAGPRYRPVEPCTEPSNSPIR